VAIARWRKLAERDAGNVRWQDVLAAGLTALAEVERDRGRRAAAAEAFEEALAIRLRVAAASPDFAANRAALAALEASRPR
jgi:hypothetical protein